MKLGDIVSKAPNSVIVAGTVCFVSVVAAFTILSALGANTADLRAFLVPVVSSLAAIFSGGALVVSGAAARSSANAENSVNGDLDKKVERAVRRAVTVPSGNPPDGR